MPTMIVYCLLSVILLSLILAAGLRRRNTRPTYVERSPNFYGPMNRLLSESDFQFLESRSEIPKGSVRHMRSERRKIFRKYLSCLAADFAGIIGELREIMANSQTSRADLATVLVKARVLFAFAMVSIQVRLLLHACGVHSLAISARRLTSGLAQVQRELQLLNAASVYAVRAV